MEKLPLAAEQLLFNNVSGKSHILQGWDESEPQIKILDDKQKTKDI